MSLLKLMFGFEIFVFYLLDPCEKQKKIKKLTAL